MKLNINIFSVIVLLLGLPGCPDDQNEPDSVILIVNMSQRTIVHVVQFQAKGDTSLSNFDFPLSLENTTNRTIPPNESVRRGESFLRFFRENPDELLMLYLFDRDTIAAYPWNTIVADYKVLRRYDLTLDSLERRNWKITYP